MQLLNAPVAVTLCDVRWQFRGTQDENHKKLGTSPALAGMGHASKKAIPEIQWQDVLRPDESNPLIFDIRYMVQGATQVHIQDRRFESIVSLEPSTVTCMATHSLMCSPRLQGVSSAVSLGILAIEDLAEIYCGMNQTPIRSR